MDLPASDQYLLTAVRTAAPQKVHLMLIEGALRFTQRAGAQRLAGDAQAAVSSLLRAQEIVTQLLANLDPQSEPARRLAGVYLFVLETLGAACQQPEAKLLDDVLRVLGVERETWQLVCQQLPNEAPPPPRQVPPPLSGLMTENHAHAGFAAEA